jgi:acetyl-CoA C-acetyltransferase
MSAGLTGVWDDVVLVDGMRTPFVDYTGPLGLVSATDLGIKAGRAAIAKTGLPASDIGSVICGSVAQTSFDAFLLPRHIGLYCGAPEATPAHLVQRVCGTGVEMIAQAADAIALKRAELALVVGAESMSRNPVAAYTHRGGFRLGAPVEFKDFLFEALMDTAVSCNMGDTAENLAKRNRISREEVDAFASRSFARAIEAQKSGFLAGEIAAVKNESFEREGMNARGVRLPSRDLVIEADTHIRPSPIEALAKIRPAFGGVQTGGNSSAIVDGAAAALIASASYAKSKGVKPLAHVRAWASVGVEPRYMGIGPVPAIRAVLDRAGLALDKVDRFEINEAFGAQVMACSRDLGLDEDKLNVNGGAIAIGHPLAASGVRLSVTVARELQRKGLRYGIASACIGGGQGIAMLVENAGL